MNIRFNRQKSAYRRGEKLLVFFKRGIIVLSVLIFITGIVLGLKLLTRSFLIKNILISGNNYLDEDEIRDSVGIRSGESLLNVSHEELQESIKRIAWIKKATFRKQFPDTLMINVEEATPRALLLLKQRMFLLDSDGRILEEIKDGGNPFLPVIVDIDPARDRGGIIEALKLVDSMNEKNILSGKESVEIMLRSYGLVVNMDGETLMLGYGMYGSKLDRWKGLEAEIKKRDIPIDYVDLRFENKIIVKPLKMAKKDK